jgi:CubicO group peptidase (beta-lactamase class C family)
VTEPELQRRIQAMLDDRVAEGAEVGVQVAVLQHGRVVVDAVAGTADPRRRAPVTPNTLFWAVSTPRGVASSLVHVLVERGAFEYDLRAAEVWPEFAVHGKTRIALRHALLHTAGIPGLPADTSVADLCDWVRACALLAAETPWSEPGTRFGYHAKTLGHLVGEILRRATGRSVSALLRDELTDPLGVGDDVHFGVPAAALGRVARPVADGAVPRPPPGSPLVGALPAAVLPDAAYGNRADVLTADIPSEGTMTALGVARVYGALLGGRDTPPLVSPTRPATIATVTFSGMDEVVGVPSQWAFGYSAHRPSSVPTRPGSTFGMVGSNGSAAYAGLDRGLAVAVLRNRFTIGDFATVARVDELVAASADARSRPDNGRSPDAAPSGATTHPTAGEEHP